MKSKVHPSLATIASWGQGRCPWGHAAARRDIVMWHTKPCNRHGCRWKHLSCLYILRVPHFLSSYSLHLIHVIISWFYDNRHVVHFREGNVPGHPWQFDLPSGVSRESHLNDNIFGRGVPRSWKSRPYKGKKALRWHHYDRTPREKATSNTAGLGSNSLHRCSIGREARRNVWSHASRWRGLANCWTWCGKRL